MKKISFAKDHHQCETIYLGGSDIATLIAVGVGAEKLELKEICYGEDGDYEAYLCGEETEIPNYYIKVYECKGWLKIYDDDRCVFDTDRFNGGERYYNHFEIFRAGAFGTIIRCAYQEDNRRWGEK